MQASSRHPRKRFSGRQPRRSGLPAARRARGRSAPGRFESSWRWALKKALVSAFAAGGVWVAAQAVPAAGARFTDVTREWGITFKHVNGAFGKKYLPETMGGGVAIFDYDGDSRQDVFFI